MKQKLNKRTNALKSILENADAKNMLVSDLIAEAKEDLVEITACPRTPNINLAQVTFVQPEESMQASMAAKSTRVFCELIDKELPRAAALLEISVKNLEAWIEIQGAVPTKVILSLLRSMQSLNLDPLRDEIGLGRYEDGNWEVFITVDGCSKILNQNKQFSGLTFSQSESVVDGVPEWIECSIFRKDRIHPITVREYFSEVRGEHEIWKKMPRRMLRHKALQQCVRLAVA